MDEIKKSVLGSVRLDSDVWEAVRAMECSLNVYLRETLLLGVMPSEGAQKRLRARLKSHADMTSPLPELPETTKPTRKLQRGIRPKGDGNR